MSAIEANVNILGLLETKGIHRDAPGAKGGDVHDAPGDHKEKKSLGEKIKEKLHRHGH